LHLTVLVLSNYSFRARVNAFKCLATAKRVLFEECVLEVVMKDKFLKLIKWAFAPAALAVAMVAFSPAAALAASHGRSGGGHGFSSGHGFSGGHSSSAPARGNFGGGRTFSVPARGFNGGHRGDRDFHGGREYYGGRGYYGPGFGVGVGVYAPYGYVAPVCNPAGFYDQYGNWQYYPGCAVPPYGY
jgi:hypothetical protein